MFALRDLLTNLIARIPQPIRRSTRPRVPTAFALCSNLRTSREKTSYTRRFAKRRKHGELAHVSEAPTSLNTRSKGQKNIDTRGALSKQTRTLNPQEETLRHTHTGSRSDVCNLRIAIDAGCSKVNIAVIIGDNAPIVLNDEQGGKNFHLSPKISIPKQCSDPNSADIHVAFLTPDDEDNNRVVFGHAKMFCNMDDDNLSRARKIQFVHKELDALEPDLRLDKARRIISTSLLCTYIAAYRRYVFSRAEFRGREN